MMPLISHLNPAASKFAGDARHPVTLTYSILLVTD